MTEYNIEVRFLYPIYMLMNIQITHGMMKIFPDIIVLFIGSKNRSYRRSNLGMMYTTEMKK